MTKPKDVRYGWEISETLCCGAQGGKRRGRRLVVGKEVKKKRKGKETKE